MFRPDSLIVCRSFASERQQLAAELEACRKEQATLSARCVIVCSVVCSNFVHVSVTITCTGDSDVGI